VDVDSWLTTETTTFDELAQEEPERVVALLLNVMSAHCSRLAIIQVQYRSKRAGFGFKIDYLESGYTTD